MNRLAPLLSICTILVSSVSISAFVGPSMSRPKSALITNNPSLTRTTVFATTKGEDSTNHDDNHSGEYAQHQEQQLPSRRQILTGAASTAVLSLLAASQYPSTAIAAESGIGSSPNSPIVVLGGGGKVGKLCTQVLADKGLYVRCTTRSGRQVLDNESKYVSYVPCDVTNDSSLKEALSGASGCIFAASSSGKKKGGDPIDVDYVGCYKTAQACLDAKVPKLVVISAGTTTRPDSAGFKATNFFVKYVYGDHIMDAKIAGEHQVRALYAAKGGPGLAYAVVRPGGLNDKPSVGSSKVHVSQGDVYSSEVTREDVALVSVATLLKGASTDFTTFELNQVEGLGKAMKSLPDSPAELVHAGASSFDELVDGLLTDKDIKAKYPDLINSDFSGDGIPPIETLLSQYK